MNEIAAPVAIVVAVVIAWLLMQPRPVFVIRIRGREVFVSRGKVTQVFLEEVKDIFQECNVTTGAISGVQSGRNIRLIFSWHIPQRCRQRVRNVWNLPT